MPILILCINNNHQNTSRMKFTQKRKNINEHTTIVLHTANDR